MKHNVQETAFWQEKVPGENIFGQFEQNSIAAVQ